jgi:hypothetical protein
LIIFEWRKLNLLNLPDEFLLFGFRNKLRVINEPVWNVGREFEKIRISIYSGHTIIMPRSRKRLTVLLRIFSFGIHEG